MHVLYTNRQEESMTIDVHGRPAAFAVNLTTITGESLCTHDDDVMAYK